MTETVRAFARGLDVLRAFGPTTPAMTVAEVARATDLNRATARRLLHTLAEQGYASHDGETFRLTPRVLDLGYAFVSSFGVPQLAMPSLERLSATLNEASSLGVLDGHEVVYVARVPAQRIMTVSIGLGTRFPAHRTSLGRALLAWAEPTRVRAAWDAADHRDPTPHTITDFDDFSAALTRIRDKGVAIVDQELEVGVRSIAVPVHDAQGGVVAAMNVSTQASRTTRSELRRTYIPALRGAVADLEAALAARLA